LTGRTYGDDEAVDVALRRIADHGRAIRLLVGDGVLPSNGGRGYVLRRVLRRAVLEARRHGRATGVVTPSLVDAAIATFETAYPNLVRDRDLIVSVVEQRPRARAATRSATAADESAYRSILDTEGPEQFVGRDEGHYTTTAMV